jgi:hypothetical protein
MSSSSVVVVVVAALLALTLAIELLRARRPHGAPAAGAALPRPPPGTVRVAPLDRRRLPPRELERRSSAHAGARRAPRPPRRPGFDRAPPARLRDLQRVRSLRRAVVLVEVLGPPRSMSEGTTLRF